MIGFLVVIGLALTAQNEPAKAQEGQEGQEVTDAALPSVDPFSYSYNPFGKRDPFRSYLLDQTTQKRDTSNPLLNFDLAKFRLKGVVWGITNPRAIVIDGDGRGHIIRRGTRIGRNRGRVVRILKNGVVVAEEFRDPLGKLIVSEFTMKLSEEQK